ncbi:MAG: hypothetical protein IPJ03_16115 [Ignavibacteriales bacterium]|nr:hypothetical protein [Ignavibacteriales bacterium]
MILILLVLLIAVASYREIQILVDRGSWSIDKTWLKFWYIDWTSFWKNFDSYHTLWGLFVLILSTILVISEIVPKVYLWTDFITLWGNVCLSWVGINYVRNLFLHIVFMRTPEWKYLLPITF